MGLNYVKTISIAAVLGMVAIFGYLALEDPTYGELWGGSYGENEVSVTTTSSVTLNGNPTTEDTGFVMPRGGSATMQIVVQNNDKNDDVDTVLVTYPSAFTVNGGTPDVERESGNNTDWNAEIVGGSTIRFVAVSDFPGVNQTGGGFYYDVSSKYDDALDYTQSGEFTVTLTAPGTTTLGAMSVKVSDSKTERGGAEYMESYPILSVATGDVFQYITVKGADVRVSFGGFTPVGGGAGAPGDAVPYVLLKETAGERTYVVLGENVEVLVEALGGVDAVYDLTIEKYTVTSVTDGAIEADVEEKSFTGLHTKDVPTVRDTDGDGLYDPEDPDDDNDGWSDKEEIEKGTDPLDPTSHPEKEKKFPWWIVAVIVIIILAIVGYLLYMRRRGGEVEEVLPPTEEVEEEEEVEVSEAEMPEEEVEGVSEAEEVAAEEEVESEVYEVPAAEVSYEDKEIRELEALSGELDEILEETEQLTCPNCGGLISPEDTVCPHCGAELEDVFICPSCGAEVPPGATSCPSCGAVFE